MTEPAWHKRPTEPGCWVCWKERDLAVAFCNAPPATLLVLDESDIARGSPFYTDCVFGPIPTPPEEMTT